MQKKIKNLYNPNLLALFSIALDKDKELKITQGTREFWSLLGSQWGGASQGHSVFPPKDFRASKEVARTPEQWSPRGKEADVDS